MGIDNPKKDQRVRVQERPQMVGNIIEVVNPGYVVVDFDFVAEPVGVATERLVLHP